LHRRSFDPCENPSRHAHEGVGRHLSAVRPGAPQRLRDARPSGSSAHTWSLPAPPPFLCSGAGICLLGRRRDANFTSDVLTNPSAHSLAELNGLALPSNDQPETGAEWTEKEFPQGFALFSP